MQPYRFWLFCYIFLWIQSPATAGEEDLREIIRRKAEEAAVANCQIAGKRVCASQEVMAFYEQRNFDPVWTLSRYRKQLLEAIQEAPYQGLEPADYYYGDLLKWHQGYLLLSKEDIGNLEIMFTDAMLLYAAHLTYGKVNALTVDPNWHIDKKPFDNSKALLHALEVDSLGNQLRTFGCLEEGYLHLQQALRRYEALQRQGGWQAIQTTQVLELGMADSAIILLRKRLFATQDLPMIGEKSTSYDSLLFHAVTHFQHRHGLVADGRVGKETLALLNVSIEERILQVKTNLERWRWLPKKNAPYLLRANIPDFKLEVIKNGKVERAHNIIVGKFYRQTPAFAAAMKYIVLNPTWTVPPTILSQDVLPAVRKDASYLSNKRITVYDASGNVVDASKVDWSASEVKGYTYRQSAGADNALGQVKFMFPNPYMVYLHDTPSKTLFAQNDRAFSSGCMRVENPLDLAAYLLAGQEDWTIEKINKAVASKTSQSIMLQEGPEVMIVYFTAWVDSHGLLQFRKDVYQRDAELQEALFSPRP